MFDRALNALMCIDCLLNGKKDNLRLGKLIDEEDQYVRSAENCHPHILIAGVKVITVTCQPEFFGLESATLTLKWSF